MRIQSVRGLRLAVSVLVGLLLLVFGTAVMAQGTTAEVELVGTVQAINGQTLTVNNQAVNISGAEINVTIGLGVAVRVQGTLQADGTVLAREVNAVAAGILPGEVEFVGVLSSMNGTTLVVNGLTIDASAAEFNDTVAVGNLIKVHATLSGTGVWVAREVELFTPDVNNQPNDNNRRGEFEFTGTLSQIGQGFVVVSGQTISTANAEINDPLVIGALVKVHATIVNGQWVAREVENARQDDRNSDDDGRDDDNDDNSGSGNSGRDDDGQDDNSGSGSDDDRDDNSGRDSDDDHDDNSGSGSDDDHGGDDSEDDD